MYRYDESVVVSRIVVVAATEHYLLPLMALLQWQRNLLLPSSRTQSLSCHQQPTLMEHMLAGKQPPFSIMASRLDRSRSTICKSKHTKKKLLPSKK